MAVKLRVKSLAVGLAMLVVGLVAGMLFLGPVGAHVGGTVGHLWRDHIQPRSDARYLRSVRTVQSDEVTVPAGGVDDATAACPNGKIALGGGFGSAGFDQPLEIGRSAPESSGTAWRVIASNPGTGDGGLIAYAVCAAPGP